MFSAETYINRRERLKKILENGIILFPGNGETPFNYTSNTYRFRQDSNFLYFFGLDLPNLAAIIDIDNNRDIIFGNVPDQDELIWNGIQPSIPDLATESGVNSVFPVFKLDDYIKTALAKDRKIHFAPVYRSEVILLLSNIFKWKSDKINNKFSKKLIHAIIELRSTKDEVEILEIEQMIEVAWKMHITAMKMAKPGITEREIAGYLEGICLSSCSAVSYPIICSVRGEILHNPNFFNTLKEGQLLLVDAGAESLDHYASDITRTIPVGGKFSTIQREIYEIVLKANLEVINIARSGLSYLDAHFVAARAITQGLIDIGIMKGNVDDAVNTGAHALFFPHGLGHMLGLDVHDMESLGENYVGYNKEYLRSNQFGLTNLRMARKLEQNFVVTDEPGIYFIPPLIDIWEAEKKCKEFINYDRLKYFKDFGGIRIEDDLLIADDGCRVLGKPIPKTISEVEDTCLT
jgi:Xaa-Pro aminopeptidase